MVTHLTRDPITIKGVFGSILMGLTEFFINHIGPLVGILSGILGLYLVVISIIQKHREMDRWNKNQKDAENNRSNP